MIEEDGRWRDVDFRRGKCHADDRKTSFRKCDVFLFRKDEETVGSPNRQGFTRAGDVSGVLPNSCAFI